MVNLDYCRVLICQIVELCGGWGCKRTLETIWSNPPCSNGATQSHVQKAFVYFQGGRLHNLSEQLVPVLHFDRKYLIIFKIWWNYFSDFNSPSSILALSEKQRNLYHPYERQSSSVAYLLIWVFPILHCYVWHG